MGDAMSHAVFPGVVLAYIVGIPAIGAFIAGLFCAIATGYLDDNSRIKRDTVMGIVFPGCLAQVWCSMFLFNRKCIWITSCLGICWAYRWGYRTNVGYCTGYCVNHRAEMERSPATRF